MEEECDFTDDGVYPCTDYLTEPAKKILKNQIVSPDEPTAVSSDGSFNASGLTDVVTDFIGDMDSKELVDLQPLNLSNELKVENSKK